VQTELAELVGLHLTGLQDVGDLERGVRVYSDEIPETVAGDVPVRGRRDVLIQASALPLPAGNRALAIA
jgi:hypothetical protein